MTGPGSRPTPKQLRLAAHAIQDAYDTYSEAFITITHRARKRFEQREWDAVLGDAEERIGLYHEALSSIEDKIRGILGPALHDPTAWDEIKRLYLDLHLTEYDADLALIFFYSVMRRTFLATGASVEYADDEIRPGLRSRFDEAGIRPYRTYAGGAVTPEQIVELVSDFAFASPFADLARDASRTARALHEDLPFTAATDPGRARFHIDLLNRAFFRNKAAYLIGRIRHDDGTLHPIVFVLLHPATGIVIDTVLTRETDVCNVFTSARSNFHTRVSAYREVFSFLQTVAPSRPKPYLYAAIGFIHPAKLELVRQLRQHLESSPDRFTVAPGIPGTVMIAFQHPGFDYVFKVIRDTSSKSTFRGRQHVIEQYWRVHRTDRVGRMLDIMTFHNLRFPASRFEPALLEEILASASASAQIDGDDIVFRYLYAEREIVPLNLYLADTSIPDDLRTAAAIDYGYAIKDLAAAGIFVGDTMTKNFGVSRHGRVILYDYDDLDDLLRWNFRHLPDPPEWAEMLPIEDWLSAGAFDVFPEHDFRIFSVPRDHHAAFRTHHDDLLTPEYWNEMKQQLSAGTPPDFYPYPRERRLEVRFGEGWGTGFGFRISGFG